MPLELSRGISIMGKKIQEEDSGTRVKSSVKDGQLMRVEIRHVSMPDADSRLSRAIDIVLGSVAREPEESMKDEKGEEPPQDSRPEKVAGQSDEEEKDES